MLGAVSLTKNADIDLFKYSRYGIGFDRHRFCSQPSGGSGRNEIIFGVDMSSSTKIDSRKKYILILGKGLTQGLKHTLWTQEMFSINFAENNNNSVWACIIMKQTVIYLLMGQEFVNSERKKLEKQQLYYA